MTVSRYGVAALIGAVCAISIQASGVTCTGDICVDDAFSAADGETEWRYVGLQFNGDESCPPAPDWREQKVYDDSFGPLPAALRPYCLYEAEPNGAADPVDLLDLVDGEQLLQIDADVMTVSYMSTPLNELVVDALASHFLQQSGQPGFFPEAGAPAVRLAILDTQPDSDAPVADPVALSNHGHGLVQLVSDLACAELPDCAIRVTTALALPFECVTEAACFNNAGGLTGTPVDVGRSIWRELQQWQTVGGENRLVLNFSLGWDPVFNDLDGVVPPSPLGRVSAKAVHAALQIASCQGVALIAAAGNPLPGPVPSTGALMPAAFATLPAPDLGDCDALIEGADINLDPGDFAEDPVPLVYPVGAVRADGRAIERRIAGEPQLVAFGDHATARDSNDVPAATQTGTSVAAAVVSAAVATAWAYRSDLPAWEIIAKAYTAGFGLDRGASFCPDGTCREVRRATVCGLAQEICASPAGECPPPEDFECAPPPNREPVLPLAEIDIDFGAPDLDVSTLDNTVVPQCAPGANAYRVFHGVIPPDWCPASQYFGPRATPWAGGQPGSNTCEDCFGIASQGTFYLDVAGVFDAQHMTLVCEPSPGTFHSYSLEDLGQFNNGDRFVIVNVPQNCTGTIVLTGRIVDPVNATAMRVPLLVSTDPDGDGIPAVIDNCAAVANDLQRDTDGDGVGNRCDPDFNNDCDVNFADLQYMRTQFFSTDDLADLTGDGSVNFADLQIVNELFFQAPGPTGPPTACDPGVFVADIVALAVGDTLDLDTGHVTALTGVPADLLFDQPGGVSSLMAVNGMLHRTFGPAAPAQADCAATVVSGDPASLSAVSLNEYWCAQTSSGRLASWRIVGADAFPLDTASVVSIEFVTWE